MKLNHLNTRSAAALLTLFAGIGIGCTESLKKESDPLPSWNEGPTKAAIIQFVQEVTNRGGLKYVAPEERIATFDNDGTLWCEQPVVQFAYAIERVCQVASDHPEWKGVQPFQAALDGDMDFLVDDYMKGGTGLGQLIKFSHTGMSLTDFKQDVSVFFAEAKHPKFGRAYVETVYQPMLELLDFLRANGFKTYICSGGGIDFMRVMAEATYGIVPEQVIGSNARNSFQEVDGKWQLMKTSDHLFNNDKAGKPEGIDLHIGRIPIFSAGNVRSGGDIAMLNFSAINPLPSFQLLINHDDDRREYAYAEPNNGSLDAAKAGGWHVVSMKEDWKSIFPFESTP